MFVAMLVFPACEKMCKQKMPKNLKPIDWSNYNDVYTIYWNNINKCIEKNHSDIAEGEKIKIYGWVKLDPYGDNDFSYGFNGFTLIDDQSQIFAPNLIDCRHVSVVFRFEEDVTVDTNEIISKKRCYVEGKLYFNCQYLGRCKKTGILILVSNADDIYFEK
jgi:hypothetical protein